MVASFQTLDLSGISVGSIRYRDLTVHFLPEDEAEFTALLARCQKAKRAVHHVSSKATFDRTFDTLVRIKGDLQIHNSAIALITMVRQKSGLNRAILSQGWGIFAILLAYKLEERGGTLIKVNPAYTSQTCSDCGAIDRTSRKNQAEFVCVHCGHCDRADTNAAINILRRNTASMLVEGGGAVTPQVRHYSHGYGR